jgi:hypothetical protein
MVAVFFLRVAGDQRGVEVQDHAGQTRAAGEVGQQTGPCMADGTFAFPIKIRTPPQTKHAG